MNTRARVTAIPALLAAGFGLGAFGSLGTTFAHQTPESAPAKPEGFTELPLKVDASGITGMPDSIDSGRYLVTLSGDPSVAVGPLGGCAFAQLPADVTPEQAVKDASAGIPSWYMQTVFGGGVVLGKDGTGWGVVDLTPGDWAVTTLQASTLPVLFTASGDMPTDLPDVTANVQVELKEMEINVTSGAFTAGDNIVEICNVGQINHFLDISKLPDGTTKEQVEATFDAEMGGTPPADGVISEDQITPVVTFPDLSKGVCMYTPLTLESGTYFLACWAADSSDQIPHAMMGMWTVITVA